jgi:hypothetical protein
MRRWTRECSTQVIRMSYRLIRTVSSDVKRLEKRLDGFPNGLEPASCRNFFAIDLQKIGGVTTLNEYLQGD